MASIEKEVEEILEPMLKVFSKRLEAQIAGHSATAYVTGSSQMLSFGKTKNLGRAIKYEGAPMAQAVDYARKRAALLVTHMEKETKTRLAQTVSNAIKDKKGAEGLARSVRNNFNDMSKYRSQLIARTELTDSLTQGTLDRMASMGITGKKWHTIGDSEVSDICRDNEAQGAIPTNQAFTHGMMGPPGHPNCRCALVPVMLKGKKDTGTAKIKMPKPKSAKTMTPTPSLPKIDPRTAVPTSSVNIINEYGVSVRKFGELAAKWRNGLNAEGKNAVGHWRGSGCDHIRAFQMTGKGPSSVKEVSRNLDKALKTAPTYEGTIYRGLADLSENAIGQLAKEDLITLGAHSSTSTSPSIAASFARSEPGAIRSVIMEIKSKTGKFVSTSIAEGDEREVIALKNTLFRVTNREVVNVTGSHISRDFKALKITMEEVI